MNSDIEIEKHHNIVACVELAADADPRYAEESRPTRSLRQLGIERIIGRQVVEWSDHLGSYGMGGPGFFGLKLAAEEDYRAEWLVLTLWGAAGWLLLDGRWIDAHPNQYSKQRPLFDSFSNPPEWDEVSGRLLGAIIEQANILDYSSTLVLRLSSEQHTLELPQDLSRVSVLGGSFEPRRWNKDESQLDAWMVSESGNLLTV